MNPEYFTSRKAKTFLKHYFVEIMIGLIIGQIITCIIIYNVWPNWTPSENYLLDILVIGPCIISCVVLMVGMWRNWDYIEEGDDSLPNIDIP